MTPSQKLIKYLALGLAIFISISIITSIVAGIASAVGVLNLIDNDKDNKIKLTDFSEVYNNVENLDITLDISNFNIKTGSSELKVEAYNVPEEFICKQDNNTLIINENEENFNIFKINNLDSKITIYIPDNIKFKNIVINNGVGDSNIENLKTESFNLKLGVGKLQANKVEAINTSYIKGGVGDIDIEDSLLNNLDLKTGVGNTKISGKITGNSKIVGGVGSVKLNLDAKKSEYVLNTKAGLGGIDVTGDNNQELSTSAINNLDVTGGVGDIKVDFR